MHVHGRRHPGSTDRRPFDLDSSVEVHIAREVNDDRAGAELDIVADSGHTVSTRCDSIGTAIGSLDHPADALDRPFGEVARNLRVATPKDPHG